MKHIVFSISLCILFSSCVSHLPTAKFSNADENKLDSIITYYYHPRIPADHGTLEYDNLYEQHYNEFRGAIDEFLDTAKIIDWTCFLKRLEWKDIEDDGEVYKKFNFTLLSGRDVVPYFEIQAVYIVKDDTKDSDTTYNVLKSLNKKGVYPVSFSGMLMKLSNNSYLEDAKDTGSRQMQIFCPKFFLYILDVSVLPKEGNEHLYRRVKDQLSDFEK